MVESEIISGFTGKMPKYLTMGNIITVLLDANRPLSTQKVANFIGISWKTARDNLEALFEMGAVEKGKVGKNKRIYWRTTSTMMQRLSIKKMEEVGKKLNINKII